MEVLTSTQALSSYASKRFTEYFGGLSLACFDIETSGLSPTTSKCILGGVLFPQGEEVQTVQYFAETKKEEPALLSSYCDLLATSDVLISYNGARFDLPFLSARLKHHGFQSPFEAYYSFDLYRAINHYSRFRDFLPNLRQKTIESYLGLNEGREDQIDGAESVRLYEDYLRHGTPSAREKILLHNRDDLVQLNRLLCVLDKLDLHRILYHEGFPVAVAEKRAFLNSIHFGAQTIKGSALTRNLLFDYYSYEAGFQASHIAATHSLALEIPFEILKGNTYVDLSLLPLSADAFKDSSAQSSGYLILRDKTEIRYAEVNRLFRELISLILRNL